MINKIINITAKIAFMPILICYILILCCVLIISLPLILIVVIYDETKILFTCNLTVSEYINGNNVEI